MIRVVVADDQDLVRSGFALILGTDPEIEVVAVVSDGAQALAAARTHRPDVVLMDIQMPVMDGIEATRHLTGGTETGSVRVLILTTFGADDYVAEALSAGASGSASCSWRWPRGCPMWRSPTSCSSATPPSRPTSATC